MSLALSFLRPSVSGSITVNGSLHFSTSPSKKACHTQTPTPTPTVVHRIGLANRIGLVNKIGLANRISLRK